MNSEVSVVLHPCVELMPAAITRRERRLGAQEPEACAIVYILRLISLSLVWYFQGKGKIGRERYKLGDEKLSRITRALSLWPANISSLNLQAGKRFLFQIRSCGLQQAFMP